MRCRMSMPSCRGQTACAAFICAGLGTRVGASAIQARQRGGYRPVQRAAEEGIIYDDHAPEGLFAGVPQGSRAFTFSRPGMVNSVRQSPCPCLSPLWLWGVVGCPGVEAECQAWNFACGSATERVAYAQRGNREVAFGKYSTKACHCKPRLSGACLRPHWC